MNSALQELLRDYKRLFISIFNYFYRLVSPQMAFNFMLGAAAYYMLIFSAASIFSQANYSTGAYDVGLYDQGIWLLSRCMAPFTTIKGVILFGDHASFYSLLLVPFFWLVASINWLYLFQAILLALGAIPLFLYTRERLESSGLALAIGLSYLLYPALQNMNMENFHPESAAVFFVIMALYFMLRGNYRLFYPFVFLSVVGKEEIGVTFAFIGLYLIFYKKEMRHGLITLLIGMGWYLLASRVIMPICNGFNIFSSQPLVYSYWFQGLMNNLFNPAYYWSICTQPESFKYFFDLLLPLAFIPLLGFRVLVLAVPALLINLAGGGYLRSIGYHYNYVIIAVVFFALIEGLYYLRTKIPAAGQNKQPLFIIALLIAAFLGNNGLSQLPFFRHLTLLKSSYDWRSSDRVMIYNDGIKMIPPSARVSASYPLVPHLTHRREIYMFPNPFRAAVWNMWFREGKDLPSSREHVEYVIVDRNCHEPGDQRILDYLINSAYYKLIYQNDPVQILRAVKSDRPANNGANYIVYEPLPDLSINDDFSKKLRIKGQGVFSMLYFPDSNYYFRNLLGEEVPANERLVIELNGYFYLPADDNYAFDLQANGQSQLAIDGMLVTKGIRLSRGFHRYQIKYLSNQQKFGLRLILTPSNVKPYIISDRDLRASYSAVEFDSYIKQRAAERASLEAAIRRLPNLISNGGFEDMAGEVPRGWRIDCWQEKEAVCSYTADGRNYHAGKYSAKIEHKGLADSRWVQEVPLKPNTRYKLMGWIKTDRVADKGAGASLQIQDTPIRTEVISGTRDWTYVEVEFKTKLGQKQAKVACRLGDYGAVNTGTAYFDDISLKEALPPDNK